MKESPFRRIYSVTGPDLKEAHVNDDHLIRLMSGRDISRSRDVTFRERISALVWQEGRLSARRELSVLIGTEDCFVKARSTKTWL